MDPSSHPACRRVRGVSGVTASVGIGRKSEVEVGSPSGLVVSGMSKVAGACILVQCVVWTGCRRPGAGPGCRCGLVCAGKIRRSVENKKKIQKKSRFTGPNENERKANTPKSKSPDHADPVSAGKAGARGVDGRTRHPRGTTKDATDAATMPPRLVVSFRLPFIPIHRVSLRFGGS